MKAAEPVPARVAEDHPPIYQPFTRMKVTVVLFGDLARFKPPQWPGKRGSVEVPEGASIDTLARQLGIGDEPCVVMLNDEAHHRGGELHEGDTVTFLPPIAGGARR